MRVVISPPTAADEAAFTDAMRRSRRLHGRWAGGPVTPEEYAEYLAKAADPRRAYFLARLRDGGDIVGYLNLGEIIRGSLDQAFLGYAGVAGHGAGADGRGDAARPRAGVRTLRLHRVEANIQPGNVASSGSRAASASASRASRRAT